jgi:hypothetical protein
MDDTTVRATGNEGAIFGVLFLLALAALAVAAIVDWQGTYGG